jgi:hypothetical protein
LLLTSVEGCLYTFHLVPPQAIPWLTDLVPTVVVGTIMLRPPANAQRVVSYS